MHGTHYGNNNFAAFDLKDWGLVTFSDTSPFCYATPEGLRVIQADGVTS
jgi:hypothetical protein